MKRNTYWVISVFLVGVLLRLLIINAPWTEDERKAVLIAKSFSFAPADLNLPMEDPYMRHPLLSLYASHFGLSIFGETKAGIRFFHFIFGILTLLVVYFLAKGIGEKEALFAIALLALNQFHMHVSIKAENNSMLFFWASLSILTFWKAVGYHNRRLMLLVGPICGLAYLTKEVSILLIPAFFIYLVISPKQRFWFSTKELYFSLFLFLIVISPWIFWVSTHGSSQLIFEPDMYDFSNLRLRRTAINFFLIEPISFIQGVDYHLKISWEDAIVDGISGIVLLFGTIYSIRNVRSDFHKLMFLIFVVMMGVLSFFTDPGLNWGEFWWAGLSLIPAVCLTSVMLSDFIHYKGILKYLTMGFIGYLIINAVFFVYQINDEFLYPPHRYAAFVDDDHVTARVYRDKGMMDEAIREVKRLLQKSPNDIDDISFLGELYFQEGETEQAMIQWFKALEIEPDFVYFYNKLSYISDKLIIQYKQEIQGDTDDVKAHYYLGVLYFYKGFYPDAVNELQKVLNIEPLNKMANYYLGLSYFKDNLHPESIQAFKKVVNAAPDYARAHYNLGINYTALENYDKAIKSFKESLRLNPDDAKSYYNLGIAYDKKGLTIDARKACKKAKQIYHDDLKMLHDLGAAYE